MELLRTLWKETFGLFVDDGSFALTIVIWVALVKTLLSRTSVMGWWPGIVMFLGLALILAESVNRFARRSGETQSAG
jgi:membrane protein implicated in regulation of membrane protease activity